MAKSKTSTKAVPFGKSKSVRQGNGTPIAKPRKVNIAKVIKYSKATLEEMKENRAEKNRLQALLRTLEKNYEALASKKLAGGSKKKERVKNSSLAERVKPSTQTQRCVAELCVRICVCPCYLICITAISMSLLL